jgi:hypothetical protein
MTNLEDVLQKKLKATKKDFYEAKLILLIIPVVIVGLFYSIYKVSLSDFITGKSIEREINVIGVANLRLKEKIEKYGWDIVEGINNKRAIVNYKLFTDDDIDIDFDYEDLEDGTVFYNGKDRVLKNNLIKRNCNLSKLFDVEITKTVI